MKKVLFVCLPSFSHYYPLASFGEILARRGYDIAFASSDSLKQDVLKSGFRFFKTGFNWHESNLKYIISNYSLLNNLEKYRAIQELFWEKYPISCILDFDKIISNYQPNLIISNNYDVRGRILSKKYHIPHCIFSTDIRVSPSIWNDIVQPFVNNLNKIYGLVSDSLIEIPSITLSFMPLSFRFPDYQEQDNEYFFRPSFYINQKNLYIDKLNTIKEKKIVYATLGNSFNQNSKLFEIIYDTFLSLKDCYLFLSTGKNYNYGINAQNIYTNNDIPQEYILPYASLCINHAGTRSLMYAIEYTTPIITLPLHADQPYNSEWAISKGIAKTLPHCCYELFNERPWLIDENKVTKQYMEETICDVIYDIDYNKNIVALNDEMNKMPTIYDAAQLLEDFMIQ